MLGIEVAQTNLPSTDLKDKTFSSRAKSIPSRIEDKGEVTTDGSGNATARVYHGLAYPPAHFFFFSPVNKNAVLFPGLASWVDAMTGDTWGFMDNFTFTVNPEALYCTITIKGVPNTLYKYKYFILRKSIG